MNRLLLKVVTISSGAYVETLTIANYQPLKNQQGLGIVYIIYGLGNQTTY